MRALFLALALLIAAPAYADPLMPKIAYLSKSDMQEMFCPDESCLEVVAFYDKNTQTIVLRDTFDPENEYDLSALLHEFVHHLQHINGNKRSDCDGDRERQAYQTQRAFLKERGHKDTDKVLGVDMFTQLLLSQCGYR